MAKKKSKKVKTKARVKSKKPAAKPKKMKPVIQNAEEDLAVEETELLEGDQPEEAVAEEPAVAMEDDEETPENNW